MLQTKISELKIQRKYNRIIKTNFKTSIFNWWFFYNQMLEIYKFRDNFLKAVARIKIQNKITKILDKN